MDRDIDAEHDVKLPMTAHRSRRRGMHGDVPQGAQFPFRNGDAGHRAFKAVNVVEQPAQERQVDPRAAAEIRN